MASQQGQEPVVGSSHAEGKPLLADEEKEQRKAAALKSLQKDVGRGVVYNVRLSKLYVAYCLFISLLTASLVIFMIVHVETTRSPVPLWVIIVDGAIAFAMIAETMADMILLGWRFWESGWHAFDFAVALISLACWILMLLDHLQVTSRLDEFFTIILLSVRYTAQAFRIVRYLRSAADATSVQAAVEEHEVRLDMESNKPPGGLQQHLGSLHSIGWADGRRLSAVDPETLEGEGEVIIDGAERR